MKTQLLLVICTLFSILNSGFSQQSVEIDTTLMYYENCPAPAFTQVYILGSADNYNSATDSAEITVFWGDGTSSIVLSELTETGSTDSFSIWETHTYALAGTFFIQIIVTMPDSNSDTLQIPDPVVSYSSCTTIEGYTYTDLNANCSLNSSDDTLSGIYVIVKDSNDSVLTIGFTDLNGKYSIQLPPNMINLTITSKSYFAGLQLDCPASGSYSFNSNTNQTFDFGFECLNSGFDSRIFSVAVPGLPGNNGYVNARATIRGCTNIPTQDTLTIEIDTSILTYVAPAIGTPAPDVINGNRFTWYFNYSTTISHMGISEMFEIIVKTNTNAVIGDSAYFNAEVAYKSQDTIPSNNTVDYFREIGVSYDPNNKINLPSGKGPLGKIDTSTRSISYRINFQNTGTAPAQNVYIIDSISHRFDLSTFQHLNTSHNDVFSFTYLENNIVRFDFKHIYLPDSASDPDGSKGYIDFKLDLKPNQPVGTTIKNTAYIYFDWNAPIVTNTALNTLFDEDAPEVSFLKEDVTCIESDNGNILSTVVRGVPPYSYLWNTGETTQNLLSIAPGNYSLTVTDDIGKTVTENIQVEDKRQFDAPTVGPISGELEVISWSQYNYSIPSTFGSSFEWIVEGGDLISSTANTAEIMWRAGPDGSLTIIETDVNGCTQSETIEVPIEFLGVNGIKEKGLLVFPNPTNGVFTVSIDELTGSELLMVSDIQGRVVYTTTLNANETVVNEHRLKPGVYNINLSNDSKTINQKLIIR